MKAQVAWKNKLKPRETYDRKQLPLPKDTLCLMPTGNFSRVIKPQELTINIHLHKNWIWFTKINMFCLHSCGLSGKGRQTFCSFHTCIEGWMLLIYLLIAFIAYLFTGDSRWNTDVRMVNVIFLSPAWPTLPRDATLFLALVLHL